jgi:hypothetical protein
MENYVLPYAIASGIKHHYRDCSFDQRLTRGSPGNRGALSGNHAIIAGPFVKQFAARV